MSQRQLTTGIVLAVLAAFATSAVLSSPACAGERASAFGSDYDARNVSPPERDVPDVAQPDKRQGIKKPPRRVKRPDPRRRHRISLDGGPGKKDDLFDGLDY